MPYHVNKIIRLTTWGTTAGTTGHVQPSTDPIFADCPWYRVWVLEQLQTQPQGLLQGLPGVEFDGHANFDAFFLPIWDKVREQVLVMEARNIDTIADAIIDLGLVEISNNYEASRSVRDLVFAIIGWQTMLYKPDFTVASREYAILNEMDGFPGEARVCSKQPEVVGSYPLPDFLLGFGMMLPPRNYCAFEDAEEQALFAETKSIFPKELDAHVLSTLCGIRFSWVDALSCHLELDVRSNTLFMFRFPSFCVSSIQQTTSADTKDGLASIIHSCVREESGFIQWAQKEDVTELLREVLLSYRLIFGQSKRSRAQFRKLRTYSRTFDPHDQLLSELCGRKRHKCHISLTERDEYDVIRDFPHLRSRLVRLNDYASRKRPRSLRQPWQDKRDSTAWLAFWSVLVFGSASILLGLIQTVFQILQYVNEVGN